VHKHGLGQVHGILCDQLLLRMFGDTIRDEPTVASVLQKDRMVFLRDFIADKIPLLQRLDYICDMILYGTAVNPYKKKRNPSKKDQEGGGKADGDGTDRGEDDREGAQDKDLMSHMASEDTNQIGRARLSIAKVKRDSNGRPIMPLVVKGGCTIQSLGSITPRPGFHTRTYIWPINFTSTRFYSSMRDPSIKVSYTSKIVDTGVAPGFVIEAADDNTAEPTRKPTVHATASAAWLEILRIVNEKRPEASRRKKPSVSGPEMYGYSDTLVKLLITELTRADQCHKYKGPRAHDISTYSTNDNDNNDNDDDDTNNKHNHNNKKSEKSESRKRASTTSTTASPSSSPPPSSLSNQQLAQLQHNLHMQLSPQPQITTQMPQPLEQLQQQLLLLTQQPRQPNTVVNPFLEHIGGDLSGMAGLNPDIGQFMPANLNLGALSVHLNTLANLGHLVPQESLNQLASLGQFNQFVSNESMEQLTQLGGMAEFGGLTDLINTNTPTAATAMTSNVITTTNTTTTTTPTS